MSSKNQPIDASQLALALEALTLDQSATSNSSGGSSTKVETGPTVLTQFSNFSGSSQSGCKNTECEDSENYDTGSEASPERDEDGFEVIESEKEKKKKKKSEENKTEEEGDLCDSVSSSGSQFVRTSVGDFEAV